MEDKNILGVSKKAFYAVIAVCVLGNVIGSFYDYPINEVLANKTEIGKLFASYGMYLSYCLYPAAGMCLYMGLKKKGKKYEQAAAVLFVVAYFMAVYYSNNYTSHVKYEITSEVNSSYTAFTIEISDYTGGNYNNALDKIREAGFNPDDYIINYHDYSEDSGWGQAF